MTLLVDRRSGVHIAHSWRARDKPENVLKMVAEFEGEILFITSNDMKANIYEDIAVLTGTQDSIVELQGKRVISRQVFTDVFRYRRGHWLLMLAQSVELPAANSEGT